MLRNTNNLTPCGESDEKIYTTLIFLHKFVAPAPDQLSSA